MLTIQRTISKVTVLILLALPMFGIRPAVAIYQHQEHDQQGQAASSRPKEMGATKSNEKHGDEKSKHYALTVTVQAQGAGSPIEGARVKIHAGDYDEERRTGKEGKIRFEFNSNTKVATLRVTADHFAPDQQQVTLGAAAEHKVILKKD